MTNRKQLLAAMRDVLATGRKPLELWRVAEATQMSEDAVVEVLFDAMKHDRAVVTFRYPPLPCAAVTAIEERL